MSQRPRIPAAAQRIQMAQATRLQQAPRIGATHRDRGRTRQEAWLRIWLRDGPHCTIGRGVAGSVYYIGAMSDPNAIREAPIVLALLYSVFSKRRYVELSIRQALWVNLKAADLRAKYERGEWPTQDDICGQDSAHGLSRMVLLRRLFKPAAIGVFACAVAVVIGIPFGLIGLSVAKRFGLAAGALGLWAGLIQLDMPGQSWKGSGLDEMVARAVVKALVFVAAVLALVAGILP